MRLRSGEEQVTEDWHGGPCAPVLWPGFALGVWRTEALKPKELSPLQVSRGISNISGVQGRAGRGREGGLWPPLCLHSADEILLKDI